MVHFVAATCGSRAWACGPGSVYLEMLEVVFTSGTSAGRTGAMPALAFDGAPVAQEPPSPRLVVARLLGTLKYAFFRTFLVDDDHTRPVGLLVCIVQGV